MFAIRCFTTSRPNRSVLLESSKQRFMNIRFLLRSPASFFLTLAILATWFAAAAYLDQSVFAVQHSRSLILVGAVNGDLLSEHEWWRLLTSQLLHVHFQHMLFNAMCIYLIGSIIEHRYGWRILLVIFVIGGTVGQVASVSWYPKFVSSGASQALMALCGASIILISQRSSRSLVIAVMAVQLALDVYTAWTIKAGHGFGFATGLFLGIVFTIR